jgi:SnoaL-like domain
MTSSQQQHSTLDALRSVAARYALGADLGDVDLFLSAFAPDAVLQTCQGGELSRGFHGHEELSKVPGIVGRYASTHHMLGQQEFEVSDDGTAATGWVYCTARHLTRGDDGRGGTDLAMFIRYRDSYVPAAGGRWVLKHRTVNIDWTETTAAD